MLNSFYTSLIHDNQVLILEALGRLEQDYRGGHREESIASVEQIASGIYQTDDEDGEEQAWSQITRDLEDVGISAQDALEYRELIIDWFVQAINEGRLMEEYAAPSSFATMPRALGDALPTLDHHTGSETPRSSLVLGDESTPGGMPRTVPAGSAALGNFLAASRSLNVSFQCTGGWEASSLEPRGALVPVPATEPAQVPSLNQAERPLPEIVLPPSLVDHSTVQYGPTQPVVLPNRKARTSEDPPEYYQLDISSENLISRATRIVGAWGQKDFDTALELLGEQLAAVERGELATISGHTGQPDRRLLRHLMGVCASYSGKFLRAKQLFESVFNGLCLSNDDEGEIAAARWLGDVCLHLQEPQNAALAWAVALDGLIKRYGVSHVQTHRVNEELYLLDTRLQSLQKLIRTFDANIDSSTIFMNTHALEKSNLAISVQARMRQISQKNGSQYRGLVTDELIQTGLNAFRQPTNWQVAGGFLVQPIVSLRTWPLQWDPTFSAVGAIGLQWHMKAALQYKQLHYYGQQPAGNKTSDISYPSVSLLHSKDLHYVTKRDITWLVAAVKALLRELDITHEERGSMIMCYVSQRKDNFAFFEGIGIKFKKLQFRNIYGLKVTDVMFTTRGIPFQNKAFISLQSSHGTEEFKNILKGCLETAEREAATAEKQTQQ